MWRSERYEERLQMSAETPRFQNGIFRRRDFWSKARRHGHISPLWHSNIWLAYAVGQERFNIGSGLATVGSNERRTDSCFCFVPSSYDQPNNLFVTYHFVNPNMVITRSLFQMDPLLHDCLMYCHTNMCDIVKTNTNLACLNDTILTRYILFNFGAYLFARRMRISLKIVIL